MRKHLAFFLWVAICFHSVLACSIEYPGLQQDLAYQRLQHINQ